MASLYDIVPDFFFRGKKYQCNICGFNANIWLPRGHNYPIIKELEIIGAGKRWVDCKKCGSSDRDRLVFEFLKYQHQKSSLENSHFLHVAPEKALNKKIKDFFNCCSTKIDFKASGYRYSYSKDVEIGDIQQLNFPNESFDFVICNHVLEHVDNDDQAIKEIYRVLKPGGFAILQVPISNKISRTIVAKKDWNKNHKMKFLGQKDHLRLYGSDFKDLLESKGFNCEFWNQINPPNNLKFRLNSNEFVIFAIKN